MDGNGGTGLIVILYVVSKVMIYKYRNSIYFAIIIWHLTVNLLNKSLKHFRRGIIVTAAYLKNRHFVYHIYLQMLILHQVNMFYNQFAVALY